MSNLTLIGKEETVFLSETTKEQIKKVLLTNFSAEKIILFGSQARGTADKHSDVDIMIVSKSSKDKFTLASEIRRALINFDYAFDIVTFTLEEYNREKEIPGTVSRYATKEGIVLYES